MEAAGKEGAGAAKRPARPDNYGLVPFVFPTASTSHADRHDVNDDDDVVSMALYDTDFF